MIGRLARLNPWTFLLGISLGIAIVSAVALPA